MTYQPIKLGVVCPSVAPLKENGETNPDTLEPLVDWLIGKGAAGI